ncbi:SPOC domain-containing protein [Phlyctema vagabunda]|uniref:Transcription factor BYE1 n=1 Tax=Phlyctema vagabunda TaxID=108571 RepID=A0ABR4PEC9_9HELO
MADEPRRSVRATKGQHTKKDDELQTPEPPKKRSKKAVKKQEEEEVEIIRCVCGARETQADDDEPWIACDNCEAWQHNVCMGISTFDEDVPEHYLCEQCSPADHKVLLDGVTKGIKVWEDRRRQYEKAQEKAQEKPAKRDRKKKGGKRTSDPKLEASAATNGKAKSPSVPASDKKDKKEAAPRSATKRKARDESHETESVKGSKSRKVSTTTPVPTPSSPSGDITTKIEDLDSFRQGTAKLLFKSFVSNLTDAVNASLYSLATGETIDSKAERLTLQLEDALWVAHPQSSAYVAKSRSVIANLKTNPDLSNGLLMKTLSPHVLATMSTDEMASKELQRERAEMKARSDKQSIMITDDGPRVRRTHKGEEVIEGDGFAVPSDNTTATSRRRSELDPNGDMATRSRENSPGDGVELPESVGIEDYRSHDNIRANATPKSPLSVVTKPKPRKQSTVQDFDINKVFSSVQSPVGNQHVRKASTVGNAPPAAGPGVDPEIDKMLEDDGNESPPYSPAEYSSDPEVVWRGSLNMDTVAHFAAVAKHVGGADLSRQTTSWSDVLDRDLRVAGRIAEEKANEYLCSLRWSPNTDLAVICLTPSGETATTAHQSLFDYFHDKKRYGVLNHKGPGNVRDTYLVPIPPSPATLPDFMENLEGHKLTAHRPEPIILIALVIRHESNSDPKALDGSSGAQSPSVLTHPQRQMSITGAPPSMSPLTAQGPFQSPAAPPTFNSEDNHRRTSQEEQQRRAQAEGEATAARILGPFINSPTVHFIMPQAHHMRTIEWEIIRGIFERDSKAQYDLPHLSMLLEQNAPA